MRITEAASLPQVWQSFQSQFCTVIDSSRWLILNFLNKVTLGFRLSTVDNSPYHKLYLLKYSASKATAPPLRMGLLLLPANGHRAIPP